MLMSMLLLPSPLGVGVAMDDRDGSFIVFWMESFWLEGRS